MYVQRAYVSSTRTIPEAKRTTSKSMEITITFKTSVCCLHRRSETAAATCFGSRTERGAWLAAPH